MAADSVKPSVTAQMMSASMPLMRAWPALRISVRPFAPRNEYWKSSQSSWNIAPLMRRRLSAQVVLKPIS